MTSPFPPELRAFWCRHVVAVEIGGAVVLGTVILVLGNLGWWP